MKRPIIIALLVAALMLVLAGIGAVIFFTVNGGLPINSPFDRRNISSQLEENKSLKVDKGKPLTLKVADDSGGTTVTGADVDTVQVKIVKTAYDSTKARADEELKSVKYTIEQTGNTITLKYEIPKSMNFNNNVNTVDFDVTVPNEVTADVETGSGRVNVSGTKGNVTIKNSFGDINLENIEGALEVKTNSGEVNAISIVAGGKNIDLQSDFGAVILKNAGGKNITLDSNSGTITLREVRASGDLTSNTDFGNVMFNNGSAASLTARTKSGSIELTSINITGLLQVKDDFGDLTLTKVKSKSYDIDMSSGSIKINSSQGPVKAQTDFGNITLTNAGNVMLDLFTKSGTINIEGAKGPVKAYTDFGNITLTNAGNVMLDLFTKSGTIDFEGSLGAGPHTVRSEFGAVDLTLPADVKLNVDLSTEFGKIKSDLPITLTITETSNSNGDQIVGSINGGGEQLTAKTNSGGVTIHAGK